MFLRTNRQPLVRSPQVPAPQSSVPPAGQTLYFAIKQTGIKIFPALRAGASPETLAWVPGAHSMHIDESILPLLLLALPASQGSQEAAPMLSGKAGDTLPGGLALPALE